MVFFFVFVFFGRLFFFNPNYPAVSQSSHWLICTHHPGLLEYAAVLAAWLVSLSLLPFGPGLAIVDQTTAAVSFHFFIIVS